MLECLMPTVVNSANKTDRLQIGGSDCGYVWTSKAAHSWIKSFIVTPILQLQQVIQQYINSGVETPYKELQC